MRTHPLQDMGVLVHHSLGKLQQACQHKNISCWPVLAHCAEKKAAVWCPLKNAATLSQLLECQCKKLMPGPSAIHCLLTDECDLHTSTRVKRWARHGSDGIFPDVLAVDSDSVDIIQIVINGTVKMFFQHHCHGY